MRCYALSGSEELAGVASYQTNRFQATQVPVTVLACGFAGIVLVFWDAT